jgi:hypothetical protein
MGWDGMGETLINVGFQIVALYHDDGNIIVLDPSSTIYVRAFCVCLGAFGFSYIVWCCGCVRFIIISI